MEFKYQWPVELKYKVVPNDLYGMRPINYDIYKPLFHFGFDITADINTPVRPMLPGVVVFAGEDKSKDENGNPIFNSKYGIKVEILQIDGNRAAYGHLRSVNVKVGDFVYYDDIIAYSGCSGASRIPHVHIDIRKGNEPKGNKDNTYNPLDLLPEVDLTKIDREFTTEPYAHLWRILNSNNPFGFTRDDIWWENDEELIR